MLCSGVSVVYLYVVDCIIIYMVCVYVPCRMGWECCTIGEMGGKVRVVCVVMLLLV